MEIFDPANVDKSMQAAVITAAEAPQNKPVVIPLASEIPADYTKSLEGAQEKEKSFLASVLSDVAQTQNDAAERAAIRAAKLNFVTARSVAEINEANKNLRINTGGFVNLVKAALGDNRHNPVAQQIKKTNAIKTIKLQESINKAYAEADKELLASAKAPLEMMEFVQKLRKGDVDLKVSQMQLLMQNRSLQKDVIKQMQAQVTFQQAEEVGKSGEYTDVLTQDFIFKKLAEKRKIVNELEAAADATKLGKIKLANGMTESAVERLGVEDGKVLLQAAKQLGLSVVDFKGAEVPVYKIESHVAAQEDARFKREKLLVDRMSELSKYKTSDAAIVDGAISTALTTVAGVPGFSVPSATTLMDMSEDELIQQDLFNKLPQDVAAATFDMLQAKQRIDEKRAEKPGGSSRVTQADVLLYNKKAKELAEITKKHNDDFIQQADKKRQWAFRKLVANRMKVSDANQGATILAQTGLQLPNFQGNSAFVEGYRQFVLQYAKQQGIAGSAGNTDEMSGEQVDQMFNALMAKLSYGATAKDSDFTEILSAINKTGDGQYSVQETIINSQEAIIFKASVFGMAEEFPELKEILFAARNQQTAVWFDENKKESQAQILELLVLQGKLKHNNPDYYTMAFNEHVYKTMQAYEPQMGNFAAVNAQAFTKGVFPFEDLYTLVNRSLVPSINNTIKIYIQNVNKPKQEIDTTPGMELYNIYGAL